MNLAHGMNSSGPICCAVRLGWFSLVTGVGACATLLGLKGRTETPENPTTVNREHQHGAINKKNVS